MIMGVFDKQIFKKKAVVKQIIEFMEDGSKTNLMLNTLVLPQADIPAWKNN
jgi:hypothetical protein